MILIERCSPSAKHVVEVVAGAVTTSFLFVISFNDYYQ